MKWDEIKNQMPEELFTNREKTDIECPNCGKFIYRRTDIVLTTYPAQYQYECDCGWTGTAFV